MSFSRITTKILTLEHYAKNKTYSEAGLPYWPRLGPNPTFLALFNLGWPQKIRLALWPLFGPF